jgi:hypothetical protein
MKMHVDEEDKTSYLIQVSGSNYKFGTILYAERSIVHSTFSSLASERTVAPDEPLP